MKTLYIDVYFLINFTVDVISLYFAAIFSKIPTTTKRLIISALLGAFIAVAVVFLPEIAVVKLFAAGFGLILMGYIAPKPIAIKRKGRFIISFLIFEALVGGGVTLVWNILDKSLAAFFAGGTETVVNRKMLFFSLIILLSIGVFKMIVSFFSNTEGEGNVEIEISFLDNKKTFEAFVDTGNLAKDPMDMAPVLLIKKEIANGLLPQNIIELCDPDTLSKEVRKRIRLIPITRGGSTHVLTGIKADSVKVVSGDKKEELRITVAIDKEGGTYGGYLALMPAAALDNAVH